MKLKYWQKVANMIFFFLFQFSLDTDKIGILSIGKTNYDQPFDIGYHGSAACLTIIDGAFNVTRTQALVQEKCAALDVRMPTISKWPKYCFALFLYFSRKKEENLEYFSLEYFTNSCFLLSLSLSPSLFPTHLLSVFAVLSLSKTRLFFLVHI